MSFAAHALPLSPPLIFPTKILVVDDEPDVCWVLEEVMLDAGYLCQCVGSGDKAMEELRQGAYSLMLTDVRMPGMSGLELARICRALYPAMKIIIMSAYVDRQHVGEYRKRVPYPFMAKPFRHDELTALISKTLADE